MRYRPVSTTAISAIIAIALLGCHGAPASIPTTSMKSDHAADIVGAWSPGTSSVSYKFKPDGTVEVLKEVKGLHMLVSGVFDLEGDTLFVTPTAMKITSDNKNADTSAISEEALRRNPLNVPIKSTITWLTKDHMLMHEDPVKPGEPPEDTNLTRSP